MARPETSRASVLVIGCGALARELLDVVALNGLSHVRVECLPAILHNRPEKIPGAVRSRLEAARGYDRVYVAYGDCGTGGMLDRVLEEFGVERLPGAHCYQFYSGLEAFDALHDEEPATFYLTDYLARHFDRLVWQGLGLDRHPELLDDYFGNYERVVYLAQTDDPTSRDEARAAADRLGLRFEWRLVGYGEMAPELVRIGGRALSRGDDPPPTPRQGQPPATRAGTAAEQVSVGDRALSRGDDPPPTPRQGQPPATRAGTEAHHDHRGGTTPLQPPAKDSRPRHELGQRHIMTGGRT